MTEKELKERIGVLNRKLAASKRAVVDLTERKENLEQNIKDQLDRQCEYISIIEKHQAELDAIKTEEV